jgi:hypothetical protein
MSSIKAIYLIMIDSQITDFLGDGPDYVQFFELTPIEVSHAPLDLFE